ncbi:DNA-(apurinic or apyrimidinic site) lyase [Rhodothalassium salexigens DSM 2132]|uniref:Formamidopyrimidine-DNA glycosylase n=1 Tax=Rhodothalassium salexigens DSM 2132 TaxID=1188247 RepID=A0A4R2PPZ8_RHOSA|nr:bifunctional DNA-formamidopyrimidine glycosylase/DNA-(apurinic or apyrimidinic site) lyase [Rhodothalassium salexigens]MBB4211063.1 formamidopyrimidine-DNA glycosylase [Rhodothalassium salexigens DSM 2132]MBK1637934.1 DNA-formamidopyrimidine glycosylase [Rhodothalassium salexigens DSM 2132]TCP36281.1 DNA-(apurinic or apyrimidinic site) lyase [Rhodothalassium salexigens DSM 2132]
MPELPEVETVRRGLMPLLTGRRLVRVEARRPDLRFPLPADFAERLTGCRVAAIDRRSKYLLIRTEGGPVLLVHLGMSGRFVSGPHNQVPPPGRHDHLLFDTDDGTRLLFHDPRRFGMADLVAPADLPAHRLIAGLGPEPLGPDFTVAALAAGLAGRRAPMKAALLDQRLVAGLGNIYVCEALFRAGISPRRRAGNVAAARVRRLHGAIRAVLEDAIASGGSSLRDFVRINGELGYFQHRFDVYGRAGEPCRVDGCGATVQRIVQSNRSSFYCPRCQH